MRFLIAAPPKTGNVWLEQLFSSAFGLHWVREAPAYDYWGDRDPSPLRDSVLAGQYPDSAICHQHFWPCESIRGIARVHDIGLISTLRNPYDQFVSWYFYIQNFAGAFRLKDDPGRRAIGKPIDHPDVLELLTTEFGAFLDQGIAWLDSGLSFIVRYESLHHEPGRVLLAAQQRFGLRLVMSIDRAVADSHRDRMRERGSISGGTFTSAAPARGHGI